MKQKKLKIQYRNRLTSSSFTSVPMIQMTGNWLEALGFSIGDTVMLEYDESGIRIRPLTEEEQAANAQDALELSIRRKQKELNLLQKQINEGKHQLSMVAEPRSRFSDSALV